MEKFKKIGGGSDMKGIYATYKCENCGNEIDVYETDEPYFWKGNHSGYAHAPDEIFEVCVKCNT